MQMQQKFSSQIFNAVLFKCPYQNISYLVCAESSCSNNAFVCQDKKCDCHVKLHPNCLKVKLYDLLAQVEKEKMQLSEQTNQAVTVLEEIYDKLIDQISLRRCAFLQGINYYGLKKNALKLVKELNQGNDNLITGSLIADIKLQIQDGPIVGMYSAKQIKTAWELQKYRVDLTLNALQSFGEQKTQKRIKQQTNLAKVIGEQRDVIHVHGENTQKWTIRKWFERLKNFEEIKHMKLDSFNLGKIPIEISPLNKLIRLYLENNGITKVQNLQQLTQLEILYLGHNRIQKIQGLQKQKKLRQLHLSNNKISEITNVQCLESLTYLNLTKNQIIFVSHLPLPQLKVLYLPFNPIRPQLVEDMVKQYKALGISLQIGQQNILT